MWFLFVNDTKYMNIQYITLHIYIYVASAWLYIKCGFVFSQFMEGLNYEFLWDCVALPNTVTQLIKKRVEKLSFHMRSQLDIFFIYGNGMRDVESGVQ